MGCDYHIREHIALDFIELTIGQLHTMEIENNNKETTKKKMTKIPMAHTRFDAIKAIMTDMK